MWMEITYRSDGTLEVCNCDVWHGIGAGQPAIRPAVGTSYRRRRKNGARFKTMLLTSRLPTDAVIREIAAAIHLRYTIAYGRYPGAGGRFIATDPRAPGISQRTKSLCGSPATTFPDDLEGDSRRESVLRWVHCYAATA